MTLSTLIAIVEPTSVKDVFDECRRLIGGEQAEFAHDQPNRYDETVNTYRNYAGQGLPALLIVRYGMEAPIRPETDDDDPEYRSGPPVDAWSIEVDFDTAYGYRAENGAGCSDLHAWLVVELGRWLSNRGLTWYWLNEYDGSWHLGVSEIAILGNPVKGRLEQGEHGRTAVR